MPRLACCVRLEAVAAPGQRPRWLGSPIGRLARLPAPRTGLVAVRGAAWLARAHPGGEAGLVAGMLEGSRPVGHRRALGADRDRGLGEKGLWFGRCERVPDWRGESQVRRIVW